jgi:hypothetical protein
MHKPFLFGMKSSKRPRQRWEAIIHIQCQRRTFGGLELQLNDFMKGLTVAVI